MSERSSYEPEVKEHSRTREIKVENTCEQNDQISKVWQVIRTAIGLVSKIQLLRNQ